MDARQVASHEAGSRPVLVYDGDCGFCTTCVRLLERIGPDAEIVAWQHADLAQLGITEEQAVEAVRWVRSDGTVCSGHEAVAAALIACGGIWRLAGRAALLPGLASIAAPLYKLVAANRYRLPGGTPACAVTREPRAPAPRP